MKEMAQSKDFNISEEDFSSGSDGDNISDNLLFCDEEYFNHCNVDNVRKACEMNGSTCGTDNGKELTSYERCQTLTTENKRSYSESNVNLNNQSTISRGDAESNYCKESRHLLNGSRRRSSIDTLRSRLVSKRRQTFPRIEVPSKEIRQRLTEGAQDTNIVHELSDTAQAVHEGIGGTIESSERLTDVEQEMKELRLQIAQLQNINGTLAAQNEYSEEVNSRLQQDFEDMSVQLKMLQNLLLKTKDGKEKECDSLRISLEMQESLNHDVQSKLNACEKHKNAMKNEISDLRSTISEMTEEMKAMKLNETKLEKRLTEFQENTKKVGEENKSLCNRLKETLEESECLQASLDEMLYAHNALMSENSYLKEEIERMKRDQEHLPLMHCLSVESDCEDDIANNDIGNDSYQSYEKCNRSNSLITSNNVPNSNLFEELKSPLKMPLTRTNSSKKLDEISEHLPLFGRRQLSHSSSVQSSGPSLASSCENLQADSELSNGIGCKAKIHHILPEGYGICQNCGILSFVTSMKQFKKHRYWISDYLHRTKSGLFNSSENKTTNNMLKSLNHSHVNKMLRTKIQKLRSELSALRTQRDLALGENDECNSVLVHIQLSIKNSLSALEKLLISHKISSANLCSSASELLNKSRKEDSNCVESIDDCISTFTKHPEHAVIGERLSQEFGSECSNKATHLHGANYRNQNNQKAALCEKYTVGTVIQESHGNSELSQSLKNVPEETSLSSHICLMKDFEKLQKQIVTLSAIICEDSERRERSMSESADSISPLQECRPQVKEQSRDIVACNYKNTDSLTHDERNLNTEEAKVQLHDNEMESRVIFSPPLVEPIKVCRVRPLFHNERKYAKTEDIPVVSSSPHINETVSEFDSMDTKLSDQNEDTKVERSESSLTRCNPKYHPQTLPKKSVIKQLSYASEEASCNKSSLNETQTKSGSLFSIDDTKKAVVSRYMMWKEKQNKETEKEQRVTAVSKPETSRFRSVAAASGRYKNWLLNILPFSDSQFTLDEVLVQGKASTILVNSACSNCMTIENQKLLYKKIPFSHNHNNFKLRFWFIVIFAIMFALLLLFVYISIAHSFDQSHICPSLFHPSNQEMLEYFCEPSDSFISHTKRANWLLSLLNE